MCCMRLIIDIGNANTQRSIPMSEPSDFDAAATMALGATLFLVGAVVGVKATAAAASGLAVSASIPIIGWICAIGGIGFLVWAAYLRDSPLEHWGTNGPFSSRANSRLSQHDLATGAKALQALQNLLMSPSVTLKRDRQREQAEGGVWITADYKIPAFMLDASEVFTNMAVEHRAMSNYGASITRQTYPHVAPLGALELPANDMRPYTLRCYYRMDELPSIRPLMPIDYYQFKAKVRHQMSANVSLPLNPKSTDALGWSETELGT